MVGTHGEQRAVRCSTAAGDVALVGLFGFFPFSRQTQPNSGGRRRDDFYVLVWDAPFRQPRIRERPVSTRTVDDCAARIGDAQQMRNALQSDRSRVEYPRFAIHHEGLVGDLDGQRVALNLTSDANSIPAIGPPRSCLRWRRSADLARAMATVTSAAPTSTSSFGCGDRLPRGDRGRRYPAHARQRLFALPGSKVRRGYCEDAGCAAAIDLDERVASFRRLPAMWCSSRPRRSSESNHVQCRMPGCSVHVDRRPGLPTPPGMVSHHRDKPRSQRSPARGDRAHRGRSDLMFGRADKSWCSAIRTITTTVSAAGVRVLSWRR